jgi:tetratricopeptide (TPR) repeat protein
MSKKIKRKSREGAAKTGLQGDARKVLEQAVERMEPKPTPATWKRMARGMASQKHVEAYFDQFVREESAQVSWEWGTLWITHGVLCEAGLVDVAGEIYQVMVENFPRDYFTEMSRGRMLRDFTASYFEARDHLRMAVELWPEGCEAAFQLGILYDLLGMPDYAFAVEEMAYQSAGQFGETANRLRAQISFNQAVAMWQASRPYGDIKAYLRRALEEWPEYDKPQGFLASLPEDDESDPRGRTAMQRFSDDMRQSANRPTFLIGASAAKEG